MKPTARKALRDILLPAFLGGLASAFIAPLVDPNHNLGEMILAGFIMGFTTLGLILCFETLVKNRVMKKFSFSLVLAVSTLVDTLIVFAVMVVTVLSFGMQNDETVSVWQMILRQDFLTGVGVFSLMSLIIQFLIQVNTLLGQGVLLNILLGRYHTPREDQRFFLFLDVKSSTAIAEKIGSLRFLSLLNDFFYDLADAVVLTKGEIYKYVGDEAILVWDLKNGRENANPLRCFYSLKERILERKEYYRAFYGLVPEFKAGLHFGGVVMGEMGRHRKEIAYLGDTVNTAARIQGECSRYKTDFLISREALELLKLPGYLESCSLGPVVLRGRDTPADLYTLHQGQVD